ncbi:Pentatricopeptide repeat-containing protein [Apostasia shenzhenica]|uniref:Pentatricopeptide repeat-containing protein n=1 Tax=Apostasia shenzhenica TaxID=1088818 RepID=A0A2I0AES8_9ASPA|nr:Pentatricopeptide repeat-containing protein [Apostasia shenzhenica]
MTHAGVPLVPLASPLSSAFLPTHHSLPMVAALPSAATSTSTPTETPSSAEFNYSRANPSIRWPNFKLDEHFYVQSHFPSPFPSAPKTLSEKAFQESDLETPEASACLVPLAEKQHRSHVKKMSKLALKRAKDWRQRTQLLAEQILALPSSALVADVLDHRGMQMTPTDLCFVVKLIGASSWTRALEAFEWLTLRRRYSPFPRMLAAVISILGRHHQDSLAEEIFRRSDVTGDASVEPSVQVFNAMMGVYARSGRFDDVRNLLDEMRHRGLEPDLVSFNTLINARAKSGKFFPGMAMELLQDVRNSGLRPDTITYNTLISACSQGPILDEAIKIFADMTASKCQPDLWSYNAMILVYCRCGKTQEAEKLFHEIRQRGFSPDAVTYNSLLNAYANERNAMMLGRVCEEMIKAGFKKDEITYNTIIHMYGKEGRLDLALSLYHEMKLAGCSPDAVTYTILIDSLGKADRILEAEKVMTEMVDARVKPTLRTFSALICGYAKAGMRLDAEKTFDLMVRSGVNPDSLAYSVMLDILLRACETRRAMALYQDMKQDGFRPDDGLFLTMLVVFQQEKKKSYIDEIVNDMEEMFRMSLGVIACLLVKGHCLIEGVEMLKRDICQGSGPNYECLLAIFNAYLSSGRQQELQSLFDFLKEQAAECSLVSEISILVHCKNHHVDAALEEYDKMKMSGVVPTYGGCAVYEALICCCAELGSFAEASQVFSDMKFHGHEPTQNIYRSLMTIYCQLGFPETAQHLLDLAEMSGITFNDLSIYVNLIETYGKLKLLQKAESLVGKLRLNKVVDRKVWNTLINAYGESGLYEQARAIFNMMMKHGPAPSVESVNGLMQALINDGRSNELYVVIQELQDMDFKISKSTIVMMLDAFAREGNIFEVKKIYHGMKAAGYLPTMHLYRSMITLLCRAKRVRDVELMITEMDEVGFKPDLTIFNALLKMYTAVENYMKTTDIYKSMLEAGLPPSEDTLNTLIIMYSRDMKPEQGFTILNEMQKQDLEPKLDTYKSLLASCGKVKLWEQAEELFESMQKRGYTLDRSFYHIMMKIYRDSGKHSKAENLLTSMKDAGVEPTIATMHLLMVSYGSAGQLQDVEHVLNNIKISNLELSTLPYSSVIDAYFKNGDYDHGIAKMLEMKREGVEADYRIWTCFIRAASYCHQTTDALLLLNTLSDNGFNLPIRLLTDNTEALVVDVEKLLGELGPEKDNACFNFVNALEDLLWAFERRATASWLFQMAIKNGIYRHDVFRVANRDWGADFRKLSGGAALVALTLWLDYMQDASLQGSPESPKSVVLITGTAEYNLVSLEKTLKAFLWEMGSPFLPCKTRTGVLVAKAHSLRMWLKDSTFCMDLELKDSQHLPKSNSMTLFEGHFIREGLAPAFKDIHERLGCVRPKKFARLALLSEKNRDKVINAHKKGRREKMEKLKKKGFVGARRPARLSKAKFMRRQHNAVATQR